MRGSTSAAECLGKTRSAVWNVLMVVGLSIGASGVALRSRGWGASPVPADVAWRFCYIALLSLILASTVARLVSVTPWAARTARRFFWTHVASAAIGAAAVPLGFAFAWLVKPELDAVGPFWAVALVLGLLALPRRDEAELIEAADRRAEGPPIP